jgi:hypothetical protein
MRDVEPNLGDIALVLDELVDLPSASNRYQFLAMCLAHAVRKLSVAHADCEPAHCQLCWWLRFGLTAAAAADLYTDDVGGAS